jgi:hypothetical protein
MFIQAQLFAAPSMGKDMGCLTRSFAGKDFIDENLDKSVFSELTNNVFTRWDANYPLSEFPPCAKFQDKEVDPVENHHIPQDKFNQVPLIQDVTTREAGPHSSPLSLTTSQKCKAAHLGVCRSQKK